MVQAETDRDIVRSFEIESTWSSRNDRPIVEIRKKKHKIVSEVQKESKRTRRRTNSGLYDKLENLPPSDM